MLSMNRFEHESFWFWKQYFIWNYIPTYLLGSLKVVSRAIFDSFQYVHLSAKITSSLIVDDYLSNLEDTLTLGQSYKGSVIVIYDYILVNKQLPRPCDCRACQRSIALTSVVKSLLVSLMPNHRSYYLSCFNSSDLVSYNFPSCVFTMLCITIYYK